MATLSALDMLSASDAQGSIIRSLTKQPGMTARELADSASLPLADVEETLGQMLQAAHLMAQGHGERRTFSLLLGRDTKRVRNLSASLLNLYDS